MTPEFDVFQAARQVPTRAALIHETRVVRYAELAQLCAQALGWMKRQCGELSTLAESAAPVAIVAEPCVEQLAMAFALMAHGIPLLPVHPRLPKAGQAQLAHDAGARCLVLPGWYQNACVAGEVPASNWDAERPLALVQTSGSSAEPRLAQLSRRAMAASCRASASRLSWQAQDRWLLALPFAHVGGLSILTRCLSARKTVAIVAQRASASRLSHALLSHRVSLLSLVPTQLKQLLQDSDWRPPATLRAALVGGAQCPESLIASARQRGLLALPSYGMTETCSQICTRLPGHTGPAGSVGPPLPDIDVRVVNGGIQVRGAVLFSGYLGQARHTPDTWFETGDLGHFDATGCLHVSGRRSDMIITGGENVSPSAVEHSLESVLEARRFCVLGRSDDTWGQLVVLVVEGDHDPRLTQRIIDRARAQLAHHARPRAIAFIDRMPELGSGKIARRLLVDLCAECFQSIDYHNAP